MLIYVQHSVHGVSTLFFLFILFYQNSYNQVIYFVLGNYITPEVQKKLRTPSIRLPEQHTYNSPHNIERRTYNETFFRKKEEVCRNATLQ